MTPEQRRALYGHLVDALPSLRAAAQVASECGPEALETEMYEAFCSCRHRIEEMEKEMDDAASDV